MGLHGIWPALGRLPGSTAPRFKWLNGYSNISWSFGQEMRMTLMDLAYAYTAIATDGTLRPPVLIKRVEAPQGKKDGLPWAAHPTPRRFLFKPEVTVQLRAALRKAVEVKGGTLNSLFRTRPDLFGGHLMGAKTGTATEENPAIKKQLEEGAWKKHSENILNLMVLGPVGKGHARYIVALTAPHPRSEKNRSTISASRVLGKYGIEIMRFLLDRDRVRGLPRARSQEESGWNQSGKWTCKNHNESSNQDREPQIW